MTVRLLFAAALLLAGCDAHITIRPGEDEEATVATISLAPAPKDETKPSTPPTEKKPEPKPTTEPKPAWVGAAAGLRGGVYETNVVVGPETSREACDEKLQPAVEAAAAKYVRQEYGPASQQTLDVRFASLPTRIVGPTWEERVQVDGEESVFLHTQVRFDDQLRTEWRHQVDRWTTKIRTAEVVRGFALAIGALLIAHLGLRFAPRRGSAS